MSDSQLTRFGRSSSVGLTVALLALTASCGVASESNRQTTAAIDICDPADLTCFVDTTGFMIRAYNGQIAKTGGKCLDYETDAVGSPVVLNDCFRSHSIHVEQLPPRLGADGCMRKHEVLLRAGTRVIGLARPTLGGASEVQLELQDQGAPTSQPLPDPLIGQRFVLDGDSIIVAADRDHDSSSTDVRVAKVQNSRGTNGSRIVVGVRELRDNEFWEFHAVDESGRDPTCAFINDPSCGFVHVAGLTGLRQFFASHEIHSCTHPENGPKWPDYDTVVIVESAPIILSAAHEPAAAAEATVPPMLVTDGVTIRGDRRGARLGPLLSVLFETGNLFDTLGNDIRFTGLRIDGPTRETNQVYEAFPSIGIRVRERDPWDAALRVTFSRLVVDHNDISEWVTRGVLVDGGDAEAKDFCDVSPPNPPEKRPNRVRVSRNFLHHNQVQGSGYGVNANSGAFPLVDGNTFVSNRHAIAATNSTPLTGYRARANIVLNDSPLQISDIVGFPFHTHDFDIHGTGDNGFGGIGGGYTEISRNTFLGSDSGLLLPRANFELRGFPCQRVDFQDNISRQSRGDTVKFKLSDFFPVVGANVNSVIKISNQPQQFDHANPTDQLAVGDFDGDGRQDVFLATGTAWYFAPGGEAEWRVLSPDKTDLLANLRFGDFDADGRTDVIGQNGGNVLVSWGGAGEWEYLNFIPPWATPAGPSISNIAVGNFNGVGGDDLFFANGQSWYVAAEGSGPWVRSGPSSFRVRDVLFGDFNGNGRTDVFGVVSGNWMFSDGSTQNWEKLQSKLTDTVDGLIVADVDGNGTDDVVTVEHHFLGLGDDTWKYSKDGRQGWTSLVSTDDAFVAAGRFLADPNAGAGLLFWKEQKFRIAYVGSGGLNNHSRQDMR